jgi:hypothetical protein
MTDQREELRWPALTGMSSSALPNEGENVKRRLTIVAGTLAVAGAIATPVIALAGPASTNAAGVCVHADININGTAQVIDQCLPPA